MSSCGLHKSCAHLKIEIKKIDATKRQVLIEVPPETVSSKLDDVYNRISKEAKIPGFRPGNAPRAVLEKYHGAKAQETLIRELIPEVYEQVVNEQKLAVVDSPDISDVRLEGEHLSFKAMVEVKPQVNIDKYKGLRLKRKKLEVTQDKVDEVITKLAKERSTPENQVSIDDKFAKGLGYANVTELNASIQRQLYISLENHLKQDLENQIIQQLLEMIDFQVPAVLIERQLKRRIEELIWQMQLEGKPKEEIETKQKELEKELKDVAAKDVKLFLILEKIAELEKISSSDGNFAVRTMEFLLSEADWIVE